MARDFSNRVYMPDGRKLYVTDEPEGADRMHELYEKYGNLKVEICDRVFGTSLDDLPVLVETDIESWLA